MTNKERRKHKRNKRKRVAKKQRIIRELERSLGMSLKYFRAMCDPWVYGTTKTMKPLPDSHPASRFH